MVKKVNYMQMVQELWKTPISDNKEEDAALKKIIANTNFGMLEKQFNKNVKSTLFDTYEDAKWFQIKYGGTITLIRQYEVKQSWKYVSPLDKGIVVDEEDDDERGDDVVYSCENVPTGNALYSLNISAECSLTNGFRYIKELLMQHHNFYLNKCYKVLKQNGIDAHTVKTDSFTIPKTCLEQASELLNFDNGIGSWRMSRDTDIKFPKSMIEYTENKLIEVKEYTTQPIELTLADEWDSEKLCDYFEQYRRIMIRADLPGSGKSYACEMMRKLRGHSVLFVCPTNVLASNYGVNGCTFNKFFSIGMTDESKLAKFNDKPYNVIVFDEILCGSVRILASIKRYSAENEDKIILATGDTDQLESIELITNQHNYNEYQNRCVDLIFPINMNFKENKRLEDPKDREKLKEIKIMVFDKNIPIDTIVKKNFKLTQNWETIYNIAYKNNTCSSVSNNVRDKLLKKKVPYEVGEVLICRSFFRMKKGSFPRELPVHYKRGATG